VKKLFQIGLLLLLATPIVAQESSRPNPPKVLRTYDWKDLNVQSTNCQIQIVSMDGMSVLKIENTNDKPLEISLLAITNSALIQKANTIGWEMKYENVRTFQSWPVDMPYMPFFPPQAANGGISTNYPGVYLFENFSPQVVGGDHLTNSQSFGFFGTKNWDKYGFSIRSAPYDLQTRPKELKFEIFLPATGTVYLRPIKLLGTAHSFDWWSEKQAGLIGGIGGSIIGCFGGLIGLLASRGKARKFVLALTKIFIALGILSLIAGMIALAAKQPYAVYYPLLLMGFILTLVCSINLPSIQRRYDELEIRRMTSVDTLGN
jgi:hypothetical protein